MNKHLYEPGSALNSDQVYREHSVTQQEIF